MGYRKQWVWFALALACLVPVSAAGDESVEQVMDTVVSRLYDTMSTDELYALTEDQLMGMLTPEELGVFATKHLYFDVDVPVVVSLYHNIDQKVLPFWIEPAGFRKTDMTVTNAEMWTYEVWQKEYPAGRIELGVNGFDYFRPHYFVSVAPQDPQAKVTISNLHPSKYPIGEVKVGALTYNDWTELVLIEVPDQLVGQQLITTVRGRGRESSIVGGFRQTDFPSTEYPEPVYLTWSADPATTQSVQWRTNTSVPDGTLRVWEGDDPGTAVSTPATINKFEDLMLANDRYCHLFTAVATGLKPDTTYHYSVGSESTGVWSEAATFTTAPVKPKKFSFFHCSDTHSNPLWGELLKKTFEANPDTDFCMISGDLVGTGLEREDYDAFLAYGNPMFRTRPVVPAVGNHDAQLGFPPTIWMNVFDLPKNGPEGCDPERTYTFTYGNAQFFVIDVMSPTAPIAAWLEKELAKSTATWKFALFHFPFYTTEPEYPHLHEAWGTLFDKYHMDVVLTGHIHSHMRTHPMNNGEIMDSPAEGTVYITSVSIPSRDFPRPKPDFAAAWVGGGQLYNLYEIDGNKMTMRAIGIDGSIKDEFSIEK